MPLTTSPDNLRANSQTKAEQSPNGVGRADSDATRRRARSVAKQQQAAERIAQATSSVSSQNNEASEASQQLRDTMQQISAAAEESSGASQQSLAVVTLVEERIGRQQTATQQMEQSTRKLQTLLADTKSGIDGLMYNVQGASNRQAASVTMISELEKQADEIGEIVKTVAHIADQTNLLALNAAIEAARARQHGKGFAVVADEVRTLAETSERSARQIRDLIDEIRVGVNSVAGAVQQSAESALGEVEKGKDVTRQLEQISAEMDEILKSAVELAAGSAQSEKASADAKVRSEEIAAAAEEQSAACEESLQTVEQQGVALRQSEQAAAALAEIADELRSSTDIAKSAEEVASAAEEMSAAVEEINRAASQISIAISQISTGARSAAENSQQAATAISQIQQGTALAATRGESAVEKTAGLLEILDANKIAMDAMIEGISESARGGRDRVRKIADLELVSRRIDKIVDAIANVSIQTNMLAVNGSVESARAGEFGKGFAVVSTDIRNLARDSAENADRIKDLVKAVQDRIAEVRIDIDETSRQTLAEAESAKATAAQVVEIVRDMAEVQGGALTIRTSAQEIAASLTEVNTGLEQISTAANESDQLVGQAAIAAKQQAQGAAGLAAVVEEIAALADELQNA